MSSLNPWKNLSFKVKLIISVINDEKTKNVIKFNQSFLFKHILN
jgi:hypothetical protein